MLLPVEFTTYHGLNTKSSKSSLPKGFSVDLHDIDLSIPGVAKTRGGSSKFTASQLGYNATRIWEYYVPSTQAHVFMGSGGTKVFKLDAAGSKTEIGSGFTSGLVFDAVNFKDTNYMGNGEVMKAYNVPRSEFRNWGITKPATPPSVATGAAGALTGDYYYAVTFVNSVTGHESSRSTLSAKVSPASTKVNLTSIPVSSDSQVDKRNIYRTTAGGAILFFLTTIADNSTTIYTDNTTDANLGTTEAPLYNDPPPASKFVEEWDGRIWVVPQYGTKGYFSNDEFLTPAGTGVPEESFGADNFIDFAAEVYGVKKSPNFDQIWFHTSKGIIAVKKTNDPRDPYTPSTLGGTKYSAISHYSIVNIDNEQWFIDEACKVRTIDSAGFLRYQSNLIEPNLCGNADFSGANFTTAAMRNIQAVNYVRGTKNQYRFILKESGQSTANKMFAANYYRRTPTVEESYSYSDIRTYPVWEVHNITATALGVVKDSNGLDQLYTGNTSQRIMKQDTTDTNDDGAAINWSFSIGWQRQGNTTNQTGFPRWFRGWFNPPGTYNISLRVETNLGADGGEVYSISMASVGDRLDTNFILDESMLAGSGLIRVDQDLAGDSNYILMTFFGNALNQILEMHTALLSENLIEGNRLNG